ncbi:hypothetical protein CEXT_725531 [Caerostris extrusa]|uniref:Uncharacterized protein n=1 Tax=Caerostris extrusa TaxID=172846 RepID=A0AAV4SDQ0_CAEEX|nr:hypothetical protein CEXT_725531 [Caerostris extrusa]
MRLHFPFNLQETRKWALNHKFPARKSSLITTKERFNRDHPNLIPLNYASQPNASSGKLIRCPEGQRLKSASTRRKRTIAFTPSFHFDNTPTACFGS